MSLGDTCQPAAGLSDLTAVFMAALRTKLEERRTDSANLAVLLIDCGIISRLDAVWGYHVGDAVRSRVTELLRTDVLRSGDLVGEMGRDEFACVLSSVEGPAVAMLAARKSLRALTTPFWIGDEEVFANPAIGIAMYPSHGDEANTLLQRAKSSCDHARDGQGGIADYSEILDKKAASRLLYENRLRTAVCDDSLHMVFQPQFDLRLGQIMGTEGLLRWADPALGIVAAEDAFAAAEAADRVADLASSILNRALRNVSEFRFSAGLDLRVAVKLPATALLHREMLDVVERALGTWSRRPGTLMLEIGQTAVLGKEPVARETLGRLKELGVKLSIDDPDMGFSSLFWLANMPFQELKIDVSAKRELADLPKFERILQSIVELAHLLRLDVVAAGVADEAAAVRLKELGCDYMQADFKGPALDPQSFVERFGFN